MYKMQSSIFGILVILVFVIVITQAAFDLRLNAKCTRHLECASGCCFMRKYCTESRKCPCSRILNPCKQDELCMPVNVQCFVEPCPDPVAHCIPEKKIQEI